MTRTTIKDCDNTSSFNEEMNKLIDLGFDLQMQLTRTGVRLFSDSLRFLQNPSKNLLNRGIHSGSCDCHGCDADCWDHECCSCNSGFHHSTDLWVDARMSEIRVRKFVIENNRNEAVTVFVEVINLMDACGNKIESRGVIVPYPSNEVVIPACSCIDVMVAILFRAPLKANNTYYAEISIKGECAPDPVTLGFHIEPEDVVDHLVLYDPCRPQKGRFVEFESCCICGCSPCTCGCSKVRRYYLCNDEDHSDEDEQGRETARPAFDFATFMESVIASKNR